MNLEDITSFREGQPVNVTTATFTELTSLPWSLALDSYQRPYVWGTERMQQLLADLTDWLSRQESSSPEQHYYMGALLHWNKEKETLFVIDGQQRLTSLALLYHALKNQQPSKLDFNYRSTHSVKHIHEAKQALEQANTWLQLLSNVQNLFERLQFSLIVVEREDLAFTFFDTQNNRGVPLQAGDLLKAFHLRTMAGHDALQAECAQHWEQGKPAFIRELFEQYLWRARQWRGRQENSASHEGLLSCFQQHSIKPDDITTVPLYPNQHNQRASALTVGPDNRYQLALHPLTLSEVSTALPFALRQPVWQGLGFFLYSNRYASLVRQLFPANADEFSDEPEAQALQRFYRSVICSLSGYLQSLFRLAVLMYVDRLGSDQLYAFGCRFGLRLGMLRLCLGSIRYETPAKYLREQSIQLLDLLAGAWRPEEVLDCLQQETNLNLKKTKEALRQDDVWKGTRGAYITALKQYLDSEPKGSLETTIIKQLKTETGYLVREQTQ